MEAIYKATSYTEPREVPSRFLQEAITGAGKCLEVAVIASRLYNGPANWLSPWQQIFANVGCWVFQLNSLFWLFCVRLINNQYYIIIIIGVFVDLLICFQLTRFKICVPICQHSNCITSEEGGFVQLWEMYKGNGSNCSLFAISNITFLYLLKYIINARMFYCYFRKQYKETPSFTYSLT